MEPIEKLRLYKTAWSLVFECYVSIVSVFADANGVPILICEFSDGHFLFRASELTGYVL